MSVDPHVLAPEHTALVQSFAFSEDGVLCHSNLEGLSSALRGEGLEHWGIVSAQDVLSLEPLFKEIGVHSRILEIWHEEDQFIGARTYGKSVLISLSPAPWRDNEKGNRLWLFCHGNAVISATPHEDESSDIRILLEEFRDGATLKANTVTALVYFLLDRYADELDSRLVDLRKQVIQFGQKLVEEEAEGILSQIRNFKQQILLLYSATEDLQVVFHRIFSIHSETLNIDPLREDFRDTREQLEHSLRGAHQISGLVSEINDQYQLLLQDKTNRRLRMLTILSAVFMPATLLAGIYGMNFEHMPELKSPFGYFITLGAMVGFILVALIYFFKAGWFSSDS